MRFVLTILFLVSLLGDGILFAQSKEDLERKRQEITSDINQIEKLIDNSLNKKRALLTNLENLKFKIDLQKKLIMNINNQLNIIIDEIERNNTELNKLLTKQKKVKEDYASMVLKSYKHKSKLNRIIFVFSANNFTQAYKRLQYYKQYIKYKDKQIKQIKLTTTLVDNVLEELDEQKNQKKNLILANEKIKINLDKEDLMQKDMIVEIRSDEKRFTNQIRIKQKQAQDIDKQIEMIIAEATAKVKNKSLPEFNLTAEAKLISKKFNENKGKLPWPVEKGIVILKYGKQPHPIVRTTTIQSNGVRILTSQNQEVRAIFDGKVYSIIISKNGSHAILVQHGNFFSVYKNLSEIYVKKGETIETKQVIGKLITNKSSGQTILNFSIFKDGVTQNPSVWIYKM
ncbi:MAG: peptidoglycan DD-metalloendopeptidase family protein [Flavobacteriaceae bacterium]|nr:peptidoglycan DD-metalloendopeptidase family protein [Flavobacteriaceae bacterium]MBT4113670.1 peptidoglycan DD-metalloendopeptidase family protein [Flavobacteriaceae bacterium]MBT4614098.1 peptidoglycan DD-metalloendopeptidase family protein [Flavobacteriaceae bacterium]MBT4958977.1 peptidoglycan DD-metalloendopeptidase family protein [Flavobacteriaceae bacterium]MBT5246473.1 peptidoglycan DD-metalloendopeptidase family protein [Flavobacteriaceae bacterium]